MAFLLGRWRGTGTGSYPTIEPFTYREELLFEQVGEPYLLYSQESWDAVTGDPSTSSGGSCGPAPTSVRSSSCSRIPIGVTEMSHGRVDGTILTLEAGRDDVGRTATGLHVAGLRAPLRAPTGTR